MYLCIIYRIPCRAARRNLPTAQPWTCIYIIYIYIHIHIYIHTYIYIYIRKSQILYIYIYVIIYPVHCRAARRNRRAAQPWT